MVLVIAQDETVRRSLKFVIEAEGIIVNSHTHLASAIASSLTTSADCTVIDEDALRHQKSASSDFLHLPQPVILLVERPERHKDLMDLVPVHILAKPLAGNLLIDTLRRLSAG
jgi:FixJ family two-component response regulator